MGSSFADSYVRLYFASSFHDCFWHHEGLAPYSELVGRMRFKNLVVQFPSVSKLFFNVIILY